MIQKNPNGYRSHSIPQAQLHRLTEYYTKLDALLKENVVTIKSVELARLMGMSASSVRADLATFGEFGKAGHGYDLALLHASLAEILGINCRFSAVLVGVGKLGQTIIGSFPFSQYGVRLKGAFDVSPKLIGSEIAGCRVMDAAGQSDFIREEGVQIAILCVDKVNAQRAADSLVQSGIQGIWNFTDTNLVITQPEVVVENIHFSNSLLALTCNLNLSQTEPLI